MFFSKAFRPFELFSEYVSHEKERCNIQLHTTLTLALALRFVVGSTFLVEELKLYLDVNVRYTFKGNFRQN